jgi:hypothetical protein
MSLVPVQARRHLSTHAGEARSTARVVTGLRMCQSRPARAVGSPPRGTAYSAAALLTLPAVPADGGRASYRAADRAVRVVAVGDVGSDDTEVRTSVLEYR